MLKQITVPEFDHAGFLSRIKVDDGGCWLWMGSFTNGYGGHSINGKNIRAHRVSYSIFHGELIQGMVVDHMCMNKACVNPEHLRQVPPSVNVTENSSSMAAINKLKTHCYRGHEFTEDNVYKMNGNKRGCVKCNSIRGKEKWKRKRARSVQAQRGFYE